MNRTFIDTSYPVALASERDEDHARAIELSVLYNGAPLITTDCVILEIGNSLARNYRNQALITINNFLTSREIEVVPLDRPLLQKALKLYRNRSDKTWGLVDCVSFVVMRDRGIEDALTSDGHFQQAGFRALMGDD